MSVESATYTSQLNSALPAAGDARSEGDDHIRLLKATIQATWPNLGAAAVTPTAAQINVLAKSPYGFLLATASASNSATIDFTTLIDSTYEEYEFHIIEALPATNGASPWLRTSTDAGSTFPSSSGDYDWTLSKAKTTTATVSNGSTTATKIILSDAAVYSTASGGGFSAVVRFFNPAGTAAKTRFQWLGASNEDSTLGGMSIVHGAGSRGTTEDIDGIRFMFSTGNITSGKFKLYGLSKA